MGDRRRRLRHEARRLQRLAGSEPAAAGDPLVLALRAAAQRRPDEQAATWSRLIEAERGRLRATTTALSGGRGRVSTVGRVTRQASVSRQRASLLFELARRLRAGRCLELGTCVGISGAYLAAGMATHGGGELLSLEGHADRADVARAVWRRLGLDGATVEVGRFRHTLPDALASGPFDLVFLDGHHDGEATVDYVNRIREACRPGAALVLDDIDWSDGMRDAWAQLRTQLASSTIGDVGRLGLVRLGSADAGTR